MLRHSQPKSLMHSFAIFIGILAFALGMTGLKMAFVMVKFCMGDKGPWVSFWDRWTPHLVALIMLPVPLALVAGGGVLLRWGFLGA